MMGLFTPRYLKAGKDLFQAARKMLCYKRDLLPPTELELIEGLLARLTEALKSRNQAGVEEAGKQVETFFTERFPLPKDAELRENCEVFLVAIVIALGIRTFFIQPFTIPTGSMQPTLNGIIVTVPGMFAQDPLHARQLRERGIHVTQDFNMEMPGPLVRAGRMAWNGRSYFDVVSKEDDTVLGVTEVRRFWFFSYAKIECTKQTFYIPAPAATVATAFNLPPPDDGMHRQVIPRPIKAGEVVARGYVDAGDHVFVNKVAYNFRGPRRGEVFVFSTANISALTAPGAPSQFYIKRLAGLPGDELRVAPPRLFVNGSPATGFAFERVMAGTRENPKDGYRGYGNGPLFLTGPAATFQVPEKCYFAMGDNSYNSSDSRYWGTVPQDNLVGCGLLVYWPFNSHWGWIK